MMAAESGDQGRGDRSEEDDGSYCPGSAAQGAGNGVGGSCSGPYWKPPSTQGLQEPWLVPGTTPGTFSFNAVAAAGMSAEPALSLPEGRRPRLWARRAYSYLGIFKGGEEG